jgi:CRISP-associated protein Cas1
MTRAFLNTLFVSTQDARLNLDGDTVKVYHEDRKLLQVPLLHLGSICTFGVVHVSQPLMMRCAEDGRAVVFHDWNGRFKARVVGPTSGNVLLRRAQYEHACCPARSLSFAKSVVAGKIQNSRLVLMRGSRDVRTHSERLSSAAQEHAILLEALEGAATLDEVRGVEGLAAQRYFDAFDGLITAQRTDFRFGERTRRPPRDRMNALLSFLYTLATNDCVSALESVGLDPQYGILHALRPGRPGLALDLVEEFRAMFLDRLALTMVNRKQLVADDFQQRDGGSVLLTEDGRKKVLTAYQRRKQEEVGHPLLVEKVPVGLLAHVQARVMARAFRGDVPAYLPYRPK